MSVVAKKPKFPIKWVVVIVLLILIGFALYHFLTPKPTPPTYLTAEAVMGDIETTIMASGKIQAIDSVNVGAQVSGEIIKLHVDVGDEVKKGDIIAQISEVEQKNTVSNAQANLNQAQASLAQAQASLANSQGMIASQQATLQARLSELKKAEQNFARMAQLISIDAVSRQDYDDAKIAVEVAQANVAVARTNIQNAKNDVANAKANIASQKASINKAQNDLSTASEKLGHTTIIAPIDGTVVSVSQKQGTTVNAMQSAPTIVTLANLDKLRINAQISEADVIHVKVGMPARFNIIGTPNQSQQAVLSGIEPTANTVSSSTSGTSAIYYVGHLDIDNSERKYRIDMTTQVNIVVDTVKNVLTIPASALKNNNGKYSVNVIGSDGFAKPVDVQIGLNNRVNVEIKSGLSAGDKVIISESSDKANDRKNRPPRF